MYIYIENLDGMYKFKVNSTSYLLNKIIKGNLSFQKTEQS